MKSVIFRMGTFQQQRQQVIAIRFVHQFRFLQKNSEFLFKTPIIVSNGVEFLYGEMQLSDSSMA